MNKCAKCGSNKNIISHHEKYREVHGYDKVVMLCKSCHIKLHLNLRKTGKCEIPSYLTSKYSQRAYNEKIKKEKEMKEYKSSYLKPIDFTDKIDDTVLVEHFIYDENMGDVYISSYFEKTFCKGIFFIDI